LRQTNRQGKGRKFPKKKGGKESGKTTHMSNWLASKSCQSPQGTLKAKKIKDTAEKKVFAKSPTLTVRLGDKGKRTGRKKKKGERKGG